jgi:MFS family permease
VTRRDARWQLGLACAGVLLAAADTYVVVVALPAIMSGVGIGLNQLQRATPIISGYLLGYVVVLPLLGRLSDVVGRRAVFNGCLIAFGVGSLITATAHSLGVLVVGRGLQGLGGGGMVPVTLSLVAARWPVSQRGVPLGVVGAVQELGAVVGPLYGAAIVALAGWRWIFWINLPLALLVGVLLALAGLRGDAAAGVGAGPESGDTAAGVGAGPASGDADAGTGAGPESGDAAAGAVAPAVLGARRDLVGLVLVVLGVLGGALALAAPPGLASNVTVGRLYASIVAGPTWGPLTTPLALGSAALLVAFVVRELLVPTSVRPVLALRQLPGVLAEVDLGGAALLGGFLACVVVLFSASDPSRQVIAASAPVLIPVGLVCVALLAYHQRHLPNPLIDSAVTANRAAWGSLLVNLAIGAALMAALVDVPLFARATRYPSSQLGAALELLRFLVAVPVGALLGGLASKGRSLGPWVAAGGVLLAALAFGGMTQWSAGSMAADWGIGGLRLPFALADVELALCGLGFGLAIAPVNAAILGAVPARLHGLAASLAVVARTIGMLAGISALTAVGLHSFYVAEARIGSPFRLCPANPASCPAYDRATAHALLGELHVIFAGAGICALLAALLVLILLRPGRAGGSSCT